jgi:transposase-like protein
MSGRRTYSDDERAAALAALAANGGNLKRTARELGVPINTLRRWREGTAHPEAVANATPKKAALAELLEGHAYRLLELAMEPDRLADATMPQLMTAFGIAVDKMRLLRGMAAGDGTADARGRVPPGLGRAALRFSWRSQPRLPDGPAKAPHRWPQRVSAPWAWPGRRGLGPAERAEGYVETLTPPRPRTLAEAPSGSAATPTAATAEP